MNNTNIFRQIAYFFLYILIQIFLAKNLVLFEVAFCFVYVGFLLLLPLDTDRLVLLLLGFVLGLMIDSFYDTLGIHAFACVFIAYLRPWLISLLAEQEVNYISIHQTGWGWFSTYSLPLIFIHHLLIFFIEATSFQYLATTIVKVVSSTLFTFSLVVISQYLFVSVKK
ncbi:MAG: Rod shape-determining protein MreD [Microscillaceae bacterium]|nr:Rod shape-determining protein MreD [Microscillaceae bacterium]MDW8460000.1 Rod shape-determining protein MreD [Cytophagales bacterium]